MYTRAYDCPNCGSAVAFPSGIAVFAVCGFCRSNVIRRDADAVLEQLGRQAQLPPDLSPLQIGTSGVYTCHRFTVTGRIRVGYTQGSWNEWLIEFGEDRWGWIAEAQGFYAASFEIPPPPDLPERGALTLGATLRIGEVEYRIKDIKTTEVLGSEGTLPVVAVPGRTAVSVDLGGPDRQFANLEFSDTGTRVFVGHTLTFDELEFSELRPLPDWTTDRLEKETTGSDALNCPACGAAIELRAAGHSMRALCGHCGSLLDTSHPRLRIIEQAIASEPRLIIPMGRRGRFDGVEYACIGFVRRRDAEGYSWQEYLLFNPFAGFRWLVTYDGHWSWVAMLPEEPRKVDDLPAHDGRGYRLFSSGSATVTEVWGEFYWAVRIGERTLVSDFIAPPFVLSQEHYPDLTEETWSHGRYLEPGVVFSAFGLTGIPKERTGTYLNQPNPHVEKGRTLRWLMPVFGIAWLLISLISAGTKDQDRAFRESFSVDLTGTNKTHVSAPFRIGGTHPQALQIDLHTPVDESWVELDVDLVNTKTKEVRELSLAAEYWSGVDDGEAWSEGSRQAGELVPAVEPGEYRLVMDVDGSPGLGRAEFLVEVTRDVMVWSNVILGLAALLAYPVFRWIREHAFERERWSVSDHSPYTPISSGWGSGYDDD
jgi:ribosomal protein S27AE